MKFLLLALLLIAGAASAQTYNFKVVHTALGNHDDAIEDIKERAETNYMEDDFSTLCALYVLQKRLIEAHAACDDAVSRDKSYSAYNNRGVYRAQIGDLKGAAQDFNAARILPQNREKYVQELASHDVRVIAASNYSVAKKLAESRNQPWQSLAETIESADIEDLQ